MADNSATETIAPTIAPEGDKTPVLQDDVEARYQNLETEKENYRKAYLKEVEKNKNAKNEGIELSDEDKMRSIAQETLAQSHLAEIAREQDEIIKKSLKENKELKLAMLNKKEPGAAIGGHSEAPKVQDTLVTPEQMAYFKSKGWDDKKIENYKKNMVRTAR